MYNRYAPQESFRPSEPSPSPSSGGRSQGSSPFSFLEGLLGGTKNAGSAGIFERLGLSGLESGDILLFLILFYLYQETEDREWLFILALVLLMGNGDQ